MTHTAPDEYDPELHGQPEQHAPAAQRRYALSLTLAVVLAVIGLLVWAAS